MNVRATWIYLCLYVLLISCAQKNFSYNMSTPDSTLILPKELNEISGLDLLTDSTLVSINDEEAIVYFLDINTGEIKSKFDFGKNADYEGIVSHNGFYALQSNGTIIRIKNKKKKSKYYFSSTKHVDFEGLSFDSINNRLLVACKKHDIKDKQDYVMIYSFSLTKKAYQKEPLFVIPKKEVHINFMPSGISIHPNGNIYIISSTSKTILVLSPEGSIIAKKQLNSYIFHQPEGITFNSKGDLFISNEKNDTYATLLKFVSK